MVHLDQALLVPQLLRDGRPQAVTADLVPGGQLPSHASRGNGIGRPRPGAELAFGPGSLRDEHVKVGVLTGTLLAALLATAVLKPRDRVYRRIAESEARDDDGDGIPDVYQQQGRTVEQTSPRETVDEAAARKRSTDPNS